MELNELYRLRKSFSIIGITGRTGSGCTKLANILSAPNHVDVINISYHRSNEEMVKHKEYKRDFVSVFRIVQEFNQVHWKQYRKIEYKHVLSTLILAEILDSPNIKLNQLLTSFYHRTGKTNPPNTSDILKDILAVLRSSKHKDTISFISSLKKNDVFDVNSRQKASLLENIRHLFDGDGPAQLLNEVNDILGRNYTERTLLMHHAACNYRDFGSAFNKGTNMGGENLYFIVSFINLIIKAFRKEDSGVNRDCHVVIDSLRNSMEIMFLKERYAAFHMVAVKGQRRKERLLNRYKERPEGNDIVNDLLDIDNHEYRCNDFGKGVLSSPDVQNCISQSDIHLFNADEKKLKKFCESHEEDKRKKEDLRSLKNVFGDADWKLNSFYTLAEQAMKLQALLQQPGLVPPSPLERCMQVAYTAKFNSGCISRQVGATVTDTKFAIKSIGWNDVAAGATPCNLRDIRHLIDEEGTLEEFSDFEKGTGLIEYEEGSDSLVEVHLKHEESGAFNEFLKEQYAKSKTNTPEGKPCSFCFKTAYNKFSGEDNQVHTRSLHAEENAMLQISKHGGQPLKGGYLFTTASTCELCAKKAYQLGIKTVFYIDPYPGISMPHVLKNNLKHDPEMVFFQGAVGRSFHKLYEPFLAYKDELAIAGIKPKEPFEIKKKELETLLLNKLKDDSKRNSVKEKMKTLSEDDFELLLDKLREELK